MILQSSIINSSQLLVQLTIGPKKDAHLGYLLEQLPLTAHVVLKEGTKRDAGDHVSKNTQIQVGRIGTLHVSVEFHKDRFQAVPPPEQNVLMKKDLIL